MKIYERIGFRSEDHMVEAWIDERGWLVIEIPFLTDLILFPPGYVAKISAAAIGPAAVPIRLSVERGTRIPVDASDPGGMTKTCYPP